MVAKEKSEVPPNCAAASGILDGHFQKEMR